MEILDKWQGRADKNVTIIVFFYEWRDYYCYFLVVYCYLFSLLRMHAVGVCRCVIMHLCIYVFLEIYRLFVFSPLFFFSYFYLYYCIFFALSCDLYVYSFLRFFNTSVYVILYALISLYFFLLFLFILFFFFIFFLLLLSFSLLFFLLLFSFSSPLFLVLLCLFVFSLSTVIFLLLNVSKKKRKDRRNEKKTREMSPKGKQKCLFALGRNLKIRQEVFFFVF